MPDGLASMEGLSEESHDTWLVLVLTVELNRAIQLGRHEDFDYAMFNLYFIRTYEQGRHISNKPTG